ncbi:NAD(P)-dependent oxidoreductase [Kitasatospora sp. RG8]|uniref:NAD-dependent epimerase/dehydratase family protein n=1 Tax=Kitasatospora sp. RG8 TaxID=2820815 RepID=UPI001AE0B114|nr:NAD(P)-dependent oxidoreductase [Kitasatospora sp. RG8]MBP0449393.1 NAD(P)-dependent oxidoreductase [Kitasatospora sp. RG8]
MTVFLVTGATGQVGRRFVPRLAQWAGAGSVRVLVRDEARAASLAALGVQVVVGDLRERADRARALAGAEVVVNVAAALRGVTDEEAFAVNRDAAVELGREAAGAGVRRFVHTSTNLVYGRGLGRPAVEADRLNPDAAWGAYAASKAEAEAGLRELGDRLPLVVARLAFVYGEGDPHLADSLHWAGRWPSHQRLPVVHHADVAQALWRAAVTPGVEGRTYNVGDDAPVTAWDLHEINGAPQPAGAAGHAPADPADPWEGQLSTAAIRRELGWRPLYPSVWTARDAGAL